MRLLVITAIVGIAVAASLHPVPASAQTRSPSSLVLTYAGFNYVSYYNGAYENADSLPALVAAGANATALDIEYGIDVQNSAVYADSTYTDSLSALATTIAEAKNHGLSVMVRPLIDFLDPTKIGTYSTGDWRSYYNPTNAAAFFASYKTMIVGVAQVAQANGAAILCIGVELDQLTGPNYLSYWTDIISSIRAVFSGKLIYSADWDAAISPWQGQHGLTAGTGNLTTQVSFWSALDYLGIDEYAPLSDAAYPVLADLIAGWTLTPTDSTSLAVTGNQSLISYFDSVAIQTGKPLIFTELGYESATDAALRPAGSSTNIYDPPLQANLYAAFFDAWRQSGSNSLIGVYFWNWDPNATEVGPGNGANFSPQAEPAQSVVTAGFAMRPVNEPLAGGHDFNGDRKSDILWRDTGGDAAIWWMSGGSILQGVSLGNVPAKWSIVGSRDFNGDGIADLLWRDTSGEVWIWLMSGAGAGAVVSQSSIIGNEPTTWSVVGTGDFDADGKSDILWRDTSGNLKIWFMNSFAVSEVPIANVPTVWSVAGVGDFNGDGKSDILWHDVYGDVSIWEMSGATILAGAGLGNVLANWSVVGTGDFNGDGTSDILWRDTAGDVLIQLIRNATLLQQSVLGNVATSWHVAETGDYDGDGKSDILWLDTSGNVMIWFMNGFAVSAVNFGNVGTAWSIQGANAD